MSRVIKFRAWHDGGKNPESACMLFVGDDKGTAHDLDCCRYKACQIQGKHITLMQFTGLTDINGVEIYEGDILKTHIDFGYGRQPVIATVIWKESGWQFDSDAGCAYGSSFSFSIIGNIYQNPELVAL